MASCKTVDIGCISKMFTVNVFHFFSATHCPLVVTTAFNQNLDLSLTLTKVLLLPKSSQSEYWYEHTTLVSQSCTSYAFQPPQSPPYDSSTLHKCKVSVTQRNVNKWNKSRQELHCQLRIIKKTICDIKRQTTSTIYKPRKNVTFQ